MSELSDKQQADTNKPPDDVIKAPMNSQAASPATVPASDTLSGTSPNGGGKTPLEPDASASSKAIPDAEQRVNPQKSQEDLLAQARRQKIGQWSIFTILIALLPILLNGLYIYNSRVPTCPPSNLKCLTPSIKNFDWDDFYHLIASRGELALICAAVTAEAIGDMFMSAKERGCRQLFAFGWCCVVFFLSAGIFVIAGINSSNVPFLAQISLAMFISTLMAGIACKYYTVEEVRAVNEAAKEQIRSEQ